MRKNHKQVKCGTILRKLGLLKYLTAAFFIFLFTFRGNRKMLNFHFPPNAWDALISEQLLYGPVGTAGCNLERSLHYKKRMASTKNRIWESVRITFFRCMICFFTN